jgi:hypothetical protein
MSPSRHDPDPICGASTWRNACALIRIAVGCALAVDSCTQRARYSSRAGAISQPTGALAIHTFFRQIEKINTEDEDEKRKLLDRERQPHKIL